MIKVFLAGLLGICFWNFKPKPGVDLLVHNAAIYTVDTRFTIAEAMVISGGKIIETGKKADAKESSEKYFYHYLLLNLGGCFL